MSGGNFRSPIKNATAAREQWNLQAVVVSDSRGLIPFLSSFYEVICSLDGWPNANGRSELL